MARSMTGFVHYRGEVVGKPCVVEISAVNHRFLDVSFRLPVEWSVTEGALRDIVRREVARGRVMVYVGIDKSRVQPEPVRVNYDAAGYYVEAAREMVRRFGVADGLSVDTLLQLPNVCTVETRGDNLEEVERSLCELLEGAVRELNAMRATEGAALAEDLSRSLGQLRADLGTVEAMRDRLQTAYAEKLRQRVREFGAEAGLTEERLAAEVALWVERADIAEELVRIRAHIEAAEELLRGNEPMGRTLNFLAQELHREVNTMGSKLRDIEASPILLRMKTEVERIREQVQNIE